MAVVYNNSSVKPYDDTRQLTQNTDANCEIKMNSEYRSDAVYKECSFTQPGRRAKSLMQSYILEVSRQKLRRICKPYGRRKFVPNREKVVQSRLYNMLKTLDKVQQEVPPPMDQFELPEMVDALAAATAPWTDAATLKSQDVMREPLWNKLPSLFCGCPCFGRARADEVPWDAPPAAADSYETIELKEDASDQPEKKKSGSVKDALKKTFSMTSKSISKIPN